MFQRSARGLKYHSFSHFPYPECPQTIMGLFWWTKVIRKVSSLINFKLLSFLVKKKGEKYADFWVKTYLERMCKSPGQSCPNLSQLEEGKGWFKEVPEALSIIHFLTSLIQNVPRI